MVDLCQWRAAIGLWNCSRVSSRGVPQRLFRTQEDCGEVDLPQKHNCTDTDHATRSRSPAQDNVYIHSTVSTTGEAAAAVMNCTWSQFSTPETVCFLFYLFLHILLLLSGDVELNPGPTSETKDVIRKKIEASLRSKYADLEVATRGCIREIKSQLYSKGLITDTLRDSGDYAQIIGEIKSGMDLARNIEELTKRYKDFLNSLSCQGGPCKNAADHLNEELEDILKLEESQIKHSVSLEEEARVIQNIPESHRELKLDAEAGRTISNKINELSKSFLNLLQKLKNEMKNADIAKVVQYLEENGLDYLPFEDLKTAKDFDDLISKVKANYDFLDCSLLQLIAEKFAEGLSGQFEEHSKETTNFRESHTVDGLKNNLTEIFNPYLEDLEKGPIARIDLNNAWNRVQLNRLRTLIGCFFPDISSKSLTKHILIKCRSVHITYYMTESPDQIQQIIACARERVDFMKRIGLYHLVINGEVILDEAEKKDFKFESALLEAAKVGDSEAVEVLLQIGRDTGVLGDISNALFDACDKNHYRVVKLLLNESANPNIRDTDGEPAIHAASRKGHHKIVELLLKENADPDARYQMNQGSEGTSPLDTIAQLSELLLGHNSVVVRQNTGKTGLMAASFNNHYRVVELLLKANADPNIQKKDGWTALMLASQSGHIESVELLLKAKADPDVKEEDGWTALMVACQGEHTKVVKLLLDANANVNTRQKDGATALMLASQSGGTQVVQLLLKEKADPNICSHDGKTALMSATFNNHHQVVELLLKEKVNPNIQKKGGLTALMLASERGHIESVELLLKAKADPDVKEEDDWTALMIACQNGHTKVVELLLNANANLNMTQRSGATAFIIASQNGFVELVKLLLKRDLDPNIRTNDGRTALIQASYNGHHSIVKLLLGKEAKPNIQQADGRTALMLASHKGHYHVVELLIKANANPDIQKNDGWAALMLAILSGHQQIVELLLQNNANLNIQAGDGRTPLMIASLHGQHQIVELLLQQNAIDPNIQKNDRWTALMLASMNNHLKVVELLLKAGADPNIKEEDGWTALMIASQKGQYQVVELLLNANADPNIVGDDGCTAIVIASQNGHLQVVKLLFTNNADPTIQKGGRTALVMASLNDRKEIVEFLIKEQEDHGFTTLMSAIHSEIIDLVLSLLSAGIMTYIDDGHVQAAIHFSKMESEVDNKITELLRYYAEDVHGMKLSESQVEVIISSEMKQRVNESSYHLDSNVRMASHLVQDSNEQPLLRHVVPHEKHSRIHMQQMNMMLQR